MEPLDQVAKILAREDTVLFVGSGVSMWSGLPSWSGLLEELSTELRSLGRASEVVDRERQSGDLMLAASYGMDQMTPMERVRFFRRVIDSSRAPSDLHREIARLGPKCFVTTNYDQLLERALADNGDHIDVVTPNDTLELPSIVQARATGFVFKPHGDIASCETIVFTREDYRELVSSRRSVFEAMGMLFASRPVVFIGFGLRDPDFLQLRDRIFGAFQSNPADHFAIMANVLDEERVYWRKHHGINLVSYDTTAGEVGLEAHRPLLSLVQQLAAAVEETDSSSSRDEVPDLLDLARYARGLSVEHPVAEDSDISLTLTAARTGDQRERSIENKLWGAAEDALTAFRGHLMIEGAPGAGKSHIVRRVVGGLASQLLSDSLSLDEPDLEGLRVPILVAMRDYRGDLLDMLRDQLPQSVSLDRLIEAKAASIYLDGVNEAPEIEKDAGGLDEQLRHLLRIASENDVVITTRTHSVIDGLELSRAALDAVSEAEVEKHLFLRDISFSRVSPPILDLLRRPLFFRAWLDGAIDVTSVTSIHGFYVQILSKFDDLLSERLSRSWTVVSSLGAVAARMINHGGLTAEADEVTDALKSSLPPGSDAVQILRMFIDEGLLVPTSKRRLAFYHHSITEYVAAHHIAQRIERGEASAVSYLGLGAWDHTLLLTLGFLSPSASRAVHDSIMRADPALGLRGLHFVEHDQEAWVKRSLAALPGLLKDSAAQRFGIALHNLPVTIAHARELELIAELPGPIGGEALGVLSKLHPRYMDRALDVIVSGSKGYNYVTEVARHLKAQMDDEACLEFLRRMNDLVIPSSVEAELLEGTHEGDFLATMSAAEDLLAAATDQALIDASRKYESVIVGAAVIGALRNQRTLSAITHIRDAIEASQGNAVFAHYMQLNYGKPRRAIVPPASQSLMESLQLFLRRDHHAMWALGTLKIYAESDPDVRIAIQNLTATGLEAALLSYASGDLKGFNDAVVALVSSRPDWGVEPVSGLAGVTGWEASAVAALLETRDTRVTRAVLSSLQDDDDSRIFVEIHDLKSWVDRLREQQGASYFDAYLIGDFLANRTTDGFRRELISYFASSSDDRTLLADFVLTRMPDLSLDDFDSESVRWLASRACEPRKSWDEHVIARVATEDTVERILLPMFVEASDAARRAVGSVLLEVGNRLGRRFVSDDGMTLLSEL